MDNDLKNSSEAKGLANNELGEYEFIVAIVIWYEVLYAINLVSKQLQAKDMLIDVAIEKVQEVISFFKGYRETGFLLEAFEVAKGIALDMDIDTTFRKKREIKRKRQFDENPDDTQLNLQRNQLESTIFYLLLIKLFLHLQRDLNSIKVTKRILVSYLLLMNYSHWIIRV